MRNLLVGVIAAVALLLGYRYYQEMVTARAAAQVEHALAANAAAVLSVTFAKVRSINVATISGTAIAKTGDTGPWGMASQQTTRTPFDVDYRVDVSKLSAADYRWDARTRTIFVKLADVTIAEPRIDWTRAQSQQDGLWITRAANQRLQQRAAFQLASGARTEAAMPEHLGRARRSAIDAVTALTAAPLKAAGIDDVRVVVRFAADRQPDERWDVSRPIADVLAD